MEDYNSRHKDEFTDLLFSWSLQDIFDENLYKHQVEKIPETFDNVDHYLGSYVYPLLEETRSELASSLEIAYKAPFAEVTSLQESPHEGGSYYVKVDHWRNRTSDRGKEPYRTLPGDIVLLSDMKPESFSDMERAGWRYTFASVITISDDESGDDSAFCDFNLKTAGRFELEDQSLFVIYLINTVTYKRIWNALRMRRNLKVIKSVLAKNKLVPVEEEDCECYHLNGNNELEEKLGSNLLSKLNESQIGAVLAAMRKIGRLL